MSHSLSNILLIPRCCPASQLCQLVEAGISFTCQLLTGPELRKLGNMHPTWHLRTEGGQLTAFSRLDGTRLSFGPTPERLRVPELLDVKLTDVCSVGCAFCYQDSRPDRQHARLEDVAFIVAEAGRAGVFEVALGGGEVSEYPHFLETLHLFRAAGVVPNFTTRRLRWLAGEWGGLRDLVGGVAVSVGSAAHIRLLDSLIPAHERRSGQLVAQVVMGTVSRAELLALMRAAGEAQIRVTLLGFKDVGRGQTFQPLDYGWWLDDLPQYVALTPVSIDTALAAECPAELERLLVPGSYHTEEGRFSAYVDAVRMTLAPSSYHAGPQYPFDGAWLAHFAAPDFVQGPATPPALGRVRLGFATNSSSSHSLVLLKDNANVEGSVELKAFEKMGKALLTTQDDKQIYLLEYLLSELRGKYDAQQIARAKSLLMSLGMESLLPVLDNIGSTETYFYSIRDVLKESGYEPEWDLTDAQSWLESNLSPLTISQWRKLHELLSQRDIAVLAMRDSRIEDWLDLERNNLVEIRSLYEISEPLSLPTELPANPADDFQDRIIEICAVVYGNTFAVNVEKLFNLDCSYKEIELLALTPYSSRTPDFGPIFEKVKTFVTPAEPNQYWDLVNLVRARMRMQGPEFPKFIELYFKRYPSERDTEGAWKNLPPYFLDGKDDYTAEEMLAMCGDY